MVQSKPNASQEAWQRKTGYQSPVREVATASNNRAVAKQADAARSFWDKHPSGLDPVLSADMKDDIASTGLVFDVVRLRLQEGGTYGDTWWATVEVNGQRFGAPFQDNGVRRDLYREMAAHIEQYGPLPASMRSYDTPMGTGYDLCAPYEDANMPGGVPQGNNEAPF